MTYQLCEAHSGNNSLRDVVLNNLEWFSTDMVFAFPPRNQVPDTSNHKAESPVLSGRPGFHTSKNIPERTPLTWLKLSARKRHARAPNHALRIKHPRVTYLLGKVVAPWGIESQRRESCDEPRSSAGGARFNDHSKIIEASEKTAAKQRAKGDAGSWQIYLFIGNCPSRVRRWKH